MRSITFFLALVLALACTDLVRAQGSGSTNTVATYDGTWNIAHRAYTPTDDNAHFAKLLNRLGSQVQIGSGKMTRSQDDDSPNTDTNADRDEFGGKKDAWKVQFDASGSGTVNLKAPNKQGEQLWGIYKVECGVMTMAVGLGKTRPTTFDTGADKIVLVLKQPAQ
jgi:hypothetical protein